MISLWFLGVSLAGFLWTEIDGAPADSKGALSSGFKRRTPQEAFKMIHQLYKEFRDDERNINKASLTSLDLLSFFKQLTVATRKEQSADAVETALRFIQYHVHLNHQWPHNISDLLTLTDLDSKTHTTECSRILQPSDCKNSCWSNRYRDINSNCNNRGTAHLGTTNMPFVRWLPAQYEDGFSLPKGWIEGKLYSGFPLPLAREISNRILKASIKDIVPDTEWNQMFTQWGQWITHDISLIRPSDNTLSNGINCETSCVQRSPCFPIKVPHDDTRITGAHQCLPFIRSALVCHAAFRALNTCEQINVQTSYIDASNVYGNTDYQARKLRDFISDQGLLMVNPTFSDNSLKYLPFRSYRKKNPCAVTHNTSSCSGIRVSCMLAGDDRANENLGLLSFHTLFLREHNRLARELKKLNPHWIGETIYQEAKKIIGAFQQIINYRDYVPFIIGKDATEKYLPQYQGYNESVDPRLSNVFAAAAMRFGHVTIQPILKRYNEKYQEALKYPSMFLHSTFFAPWNLIEEGGVDPIFRGLLGYPGKLQTQSAMMPDELREKLFAGQHHIALDLSSINIQRSRDHGLPGYNAWRRFCRLSESQNLLDLSLVLNNMDLATDLLDLYGTPENIDVWVGGISEPFVKGGRVGPLFACLIGQQFKNLRDGDRFWWENVEVFTASQQQALRQISFSRLICDNTRIEEIPRDVFRYRPYPEGYVGCNHISPLDLSAWKEETNATPCGFIPIVAHAHFSICKSSVRYTCESGFKLEGQDVIKCLSGRQWNSAPPSCTDVSGRSEGITGSKGGESEPGSAESKEDTWLTDIFDDSNTSGSGVST
ncbi:myeloperoxidase-like isoform X1 [Scyliorhinus canicula]|uniref:myeloperoxidase-like isoform X1 n=2 Tax=Scyliorhinus canicula TaxID=7830 RepID=UPI0018F72C7F|nr:myeloperoxidase-like isoform X1 [Scyliorhinus canicula]XP_038669917.1 myeloperoxidase-like isoform X1 [Scyliorhinus canicula]